MAKQGWLGSVALAVGASAATAAAQFGLGYGFGVIEWAPAAGMTVTSDKVWLVSLAWTLWIAASSTVVGAIAADRRSLGELGAAPPRANGKQTVFATAVWRALLAVSSAIGALLSVALVLTPAQLAGRTDTNAPELIAAGYAIVGIIAGIVVAVAALAARAAAVNVVATVAWIWLLATASLIYDAVNGRSHGSTSIEVWPFGSEHYFRDTWSWSGALVMLSSAAVIGILAAIGGIRRNENKVGVATSGGAGPALVMAAYMLTIPTLAGVADPQRSASILAPVALIAGAAGSVLVVAIASSREASIRDRAAREAGAAAAAGPVTGVAVAPGNATVEKAPPPKAPGSKPGAPGPKPKPASPGPKPSPSTSGADETTVKLSIPAQLGSPGRPTPDAGATQPADDTADSGGTPDHGKPTAGDGKGEPGAARKPGSGSKRGKRR